MPSRAALLCCLLLASCSGFTQSKVNSDGSADQGRPPSPNGDGGDLRVADADADVDATSGGGIGPGPEGALPGGYCCETDADCRFRTCVEAGGVKSCRDFCLSDVICKGLVSGWQCNRGEARCEPGPTAPASCVPEESFRHGAKPLGACCEASDDARAGAECLSNLCQQIGESPNPFFCARDCVKPADCPTGFRCYNSGFGFASCGPVVDPYTCE